MNARLWLPSVAAALNGSGSIAASPSWLHGRGWTARRRAHTPASSPVDVQFSDTRTTELWSSVLTRAIPGVEGFAMMLIMSYFAAGILAILFGA